MAIPIIMPKFGQMTEESAIVEWLKKEGDPVAKGDILFTVETDKSVMEVESFERARCSRSPWRRGQRPGAEHGRFSRPAGRTDPGRRRGRSRRAVPGARPAATQVSRPGPRAPRRRAHSSIGPSVPAPALFRISPRAAALARRCVIDPALVGPGPLGRVVERDVIPYFEARDYASLRVSPGGQGSGGEGGPRPPRHPRRRRRRRKAHRGRRRRAHRFAEKPSRYRACGGSWPSA